MKKILQPLFLLLVLLVPMAAMADSANTLCKVTRGSLLGDVNGDQAVNMDDLTMLINVLLGSDISFNTPLADSNLDGEVNMDDLTALINILLNNN